MKLPLRWLQDHLETDASAADIAAALTDLGLEVEAVRAPAPEMQAFVVARVIRAERHPDADRLRVCKLDTGGGVVQVVCGAPNARDGLRGVFAPPGVRIPGTGLELRETSIRGVASAGMLLSERELGLSDEHEGIIELPEDAPVGIGYAAYAGLDDTVIEIAVTPNRPDALGMRGAARDLAARGLGRLRPLAAEPVAGQGPSPVQVELAEEVRGGACPLFVGRTLSGVRNGDSPAWLKQRLRAVGIRPISAVVDVTNYVTHDLCRPLHAFDADKLAGSLEVRLARPGESLEALDGKRYELPEGATVIADGAGAEALGGIIGGRATGCGADTCSVFLESAWFDPVRTASTGRRLGLQTDARYRFERGVDPAFTADGIEVATRMILDICGGEASDRVVAGAPPPAPAPIVYRPARAGEILGVEIASEEQVGILRRLGFGVEERGGEALTVRPPTWRPRMHGQEDIVEEVGRIASFARIPATPLPRRSPGLQAPALRVGQRRAGEARRLLASRGMAECVTYSFVSEEDALAFGGGEPGLRLSNPISPELAVMRPSVLPSLLRAASRNAARGMRDLALFEVGPVFTGAGPGDQLGVAGGVRAGAAVARGWNVVPRAVDVFDAKADALALVEALGGPADRLQAQQKASSWFHPERSGRLALGPRNVIAEFGELHPDIVEAGKLEGRVAAFEITLERLPLRGGPARPPLRASNYPAVPRDFAFVLEEEVPAGALLAAVRRADPKLVEHAEVFDVFVGDRAAAQFGAGRKSVAVQVRLRAGDRTLSEAEIGRISDAVVASVRKRVGGMLRSQC